MSDYTRKKPNQNIEIIYCQKGLLKSNHIPMKHHIMTVWSGAGNLEEWRRPSGSKTAPIQLQLGRSILWKGWCNSFYIKILPVRYIYSRKIHSRFHDTVTPIFLYIAKIIPFQLSGACMLATLESFMYLIFCVKFSLYTLCLW